MRPTPLPLLLLALLPAMAAAQGLPGRVQNMDISFMAGVSHYGAQNVGGIPVSSSRVSCELFNYGYQMAHAGAGSLWFEFMPISFGLSHPTAPTNSEHIDLNLTTFTPGVRYMLPLHRRVSVYGVGGGGFGFFEYPVATGGPNPVIQVNSVTHGVIEIGGGIDVRLWHMFSVRAEARDYITGHNLDGIRGPNHILPLFGVAAHF
jgi:hypothetical protein